MRNPRSVAAEAAFRDRLKELGAVLLDPWKGVHGKHRVICAAGHECYALPGSVRKGHGICLICAGLDPVTAEAKFRARLAELGATPLYEEYRGGHHGHLARCTAGHTCYPRPAGVRRGEGICLTCAGRDSALAEAVFRARLADLGAELLEPYVNNRTSVRVRCAEGHECKPTPSYVATGGGICRTCAGQDTAGAEARFRVRLAELGAELLEPYINSVSPHRVRCANGHACRVRPGSLQQGGGLCRICIGRDPASAEAAFRARLAELGAVLIEPTWLGSATPHLVLCPQSHLSRPTPGNVMQGHGACRFCAGAEWDIFYVVTGASGVKFGISSGEAHRHRLQIHAAQGYTDVVRLITELPDMVALDAENAVKSALVLAGEKPVRGREYFDISCLALILDVADSWLSTPAETAELEWAQEALFAA